MNHEGNFDQAIKLIDLAADAGADAAKFQSYKAEKLLLLSHQHTGIKPGTYHTRENCSKNMIGLTQLNTKL